MRGRRIRVLHVIQNLNYGGMERLLCDIVGGIDPARFESHVLCLQYAGRFAQGLGAETMLHLAPPMPRFSMVLPRALTRTIAGIAPDIVHTHSGVWYKASLAARHAGVPFVVHTEHGRRHPDPVSHRLIDTVAARRTHTVVAVAERLAADLVERGIARDGQVRIIRNGVDTERFRPQPDSGDLRREFGISPGQPVIGSIGRLEPVKGYDVMAAAFRLLRADWPAGNPAPFLVIAGDGSERPRLPALLGAAADAARLTGWRSDIGALHAMFDLFTMSSHSEGTSVSLLEAMSAGLCPVVTHVGGNGAVLGAGLAHRLVAPADPLALATAWREALLDPHRRERDGTAARHRILATFGLDRMLRQYEDLYAAGAGALRRPRAGPAIARPGAH